MTRKEIIIKAWMDLNIETPFGICDKTGWCTGILQNEVYFFDSEYIDIVDKIDSIIQNDGFAKFRPKSLRGIENNNGWIKIESEESLPKEYDFYDACCFSEKFPKDVPMFYGCNLPDLRNYFIEELITHYRPIVKHDYPIFQAVIPNIPSIADGGTTEN